MTFLCANNFFFVNFLTIVLLLHCQIRCLCIAATNLSTVQSALLALKSHINADPHNIMANWSSDNYYVCDWIGVTCGSHHNIRVIALNISDMNLSGTIPPNFGNLSYLVSLDTSRNNFHGNLPGDLAHMRRLEVADFSSNSLSGEVPSWFGFLTEIRVLSLANNKYNGFIPPSIFNLSRLEALNLQFNSLQGKIPEGIQNLPSLKSLNLSNNHLTGVIPKGVGNLSNLRWLDMGNNQILGLLPLTVLNISTMQHISLANNSLSGHLPANVCNHLSKLEVLNLEGNKFHGQIPVRLFQCSALQILSLENNKLMGRIPKEIGNLTFMKELYLGKNNFTGAIPQEVRSLYQLEKLSLRHNMLNGGIPERIFNISTLRDLSLTNNNLTGTLPSTMGYGLHNLEELKINLNDIGGVIPDSISNASKLTVVSLRLNKFTGSVPNSLGDLRFLEFLSFARNNISSDSSLSFIDSLTKCRNLKYLIVNNNPLSGILPSSVGNLSGSLENIYAANCRIRGSVPNEIGNLSNLMLLDLSENELSGFIPRTIGNLQKLQRLAFNDNRMRMSFPISLCDLQNLGSLQLRKTQIWGAIPDCLGNVTSLREIYLDSNALSSNVPTSLWKLKDLFVLNLSSNSLLGFIPPDIGNLKGAGVIDLSFNQLSNNIPNAIGNLQNLFNLSLAHNRLQGPIPDSIGNMLSLELLDLSHNNLSGLIPKSMEDLQTLKYFNVSFNRLRGEIPSAGPFTNFTSASFLSNEAFCGAQKFNFPPCHTKERSMKRKAIQIVLFVIGIAATTILITSAIIIILKWKRKENVTGRLGLYSVSGGQARFSYYELLQATDAYSESNLLGTGSFGSVYRGILKDGRCFAIKVFNLHFEDAYKSFDTECEVLRNIRHRNLTKVIGSCSNPDFKALVLEYMSNGSLEKWLYSHNNFLDIHQRIDIMIDVACALEYLHHGYSLPIIHCDLKPSNILLDDEMVAHVSDFGIAKLLGEEESVIHTNTLATMGYIAPEYGLEGLVSKGSDIYSFGIILMEIFTRTQPNDEMFSGDFSLKRWVQESLPNTINGVVDANLLMQEDDQTNVPYKLQCISVILELALNCCSEYPENRISMQDVVVELKKIKHQLSLRA